MEKRLQHAQYILGYFNNYDDQHPESKELSVFCSDSSIQTFPLLLGAASKFLRELLTDPSLGEDTCIIVPDLSVNHFETFFKYLFCRNGFGLVSDDDMNSLKEVFHLLRFDYQFTSLFGEINAIYEDSERMDDLDGSSQVIRNSTKKVLDISKRRKNQCNQEPSFTRGSGQFLNCRFCSKTYRHTKARNKHLLADHFDRCKEESIIHPCKMCGTCFIGAKGLEKHVARLHGSKSQPARVFGVTLDDEILNAVSHYECPFHIGEHFRASTLKDFKYHIKEVHPDKDKSCYACGQECLTRENLEIHIQSHLTKSKEARYFYNCEYCHFKFLSEYNLVIHKRDEHSDSLTIRCKVCKKEFKNKKFLRSHEIKHFQKQSYSETNISPFKCDFNLEDGTLCEKIFKIKANLDRHMRSHQKIKTHSCSECGKLFVDSTRLKEHRWIHSDHRPFPCKFCSKSFRHQNHVRNHEANVHGEEKSFSCELCKKRFVYAYQLKTHLKSHRGCDGELNTSVFAESTRSEEETLNAVETVFQCSVCHEVLQTFPKLQEHCQTHSDGGLSQEPPKTDFFIEIPDFQTSSDLSPSQFVVVYDVPSYDL